MRKKLSSRRSRHSRRMRFFEPLEPRLMLTTEEFAATPFVTNESFSVARFMESLRYALYRADQSSADEVVVNLMGETLSDFNLASTASSAQVRNSTDFVVDLGWGDLDIRRDMTIRGNGAVIDAHQLDRIFDIRGGAHVVIENLTIKNGKSIGGQGGAIRVREDSDLELSNVTFLDNQSANSNGITRGGAIYADNTGGSIVIHGGEFRGNTATATIGRAGDGGAIFVLGSMDLTIDGTKFVNNKATSTLSTSNTGDKGGGAYGGAISFSEGSPVVTITNAVFENNSALGPNRGRGDNSERTGGGNAKGGAIALNSTSAATLNITKTKFIGNMAKGGDGGLASDEFGGSGGLAQGGAIQLSQFTSLTIDDVLFLENKALGGFAGRNLSDSGEEGGWGGDAQGGAVHLVSSLANVEVNMTTALFDANRAIGGLGHRAKDIGPHGGHASGGAIYTSDGRNELQHVTFARNVAEGGRGGYEVPPGGRNGRGGAGGDAYGGAIAAVEDSTLIIIGTIDAQATAAPENNAVHSTSSFVLNSSLGGNGRNDFNGPGGVGRGGAIYASNRSWSANGVFFQANSAHGGNGGRKVDDNVIVIGGSQPVLPLGGENGRGSGGAIHSSGSDTTIENSSFVSNVAIAGQIEEGKNINALASGPRAAGGWARGGAITVDDASLDIDGAGFFNNKAIASGGGPGTRGYDGGVGGTAVGGAVRVVNSDHVAISNSYLHGNAAQAGPGGNGTEGPLRLGDGGRGGDALGGAVDIEGDSSSAKTDVLVFRSWAHQNLAIAGDGGVGGNGDTEAIDDEGYDNFGSSASVGGTGGNAHGGGIRLLHVTAEIDNSTLSKNVASAGWGGTGGLGDGGHWVGGRGGDGGDAGDAWGGAVALLAGTLDITYSTIVENAAIAGYGGTGGFGSTGAFIGGAGGHAGDGGDSLGGGVYHDGQSVTILASTIARNAVISGGAGLRGPGLHRSGLINSGYALGLQAGTILECSPPGQCVPASHQKLAAGAAADVQDHLTNLTQRAAGSTVFVSNSEVILQPGYLETGGADAILGAVALGGITGAIGLTAAAGVIGGIIAGSTLGGVSAAGITLGTTALATSASVTASGVIPAVLGFSFAGFGAVAFPVTAVAAGLVLPALVLTQFVIGLVVNDGDVHDAMLYVVGGGEECSAASGINFAALICSTERPEADLPSPPDATDNRAAFGSAGTDGNARGTNIYVADGSALNIQRTIVAQGIATVRTRSTKAVPDAYEVNETRTRFTSFADVWGDFDTDGTNLIGMTTLQQPATDLHGTNLQPLDPRFAERLALHGGSTPTLKLLPGSPARGAVLLPLAGSDISQNDYPWLAVADVGAWGGPANRAPVGLDDSFTTLEDQELVIPLRQLLANDTDPDNDALLLAHNQIVFAGNLLTPITQPEPAVRMKALEGNATFTYRVSDSELQSSPATVTIDVTPVNDAPSFNATDVFTNEDPGPREIANWAVFQPGGANESDQTVAAYTVSDISNAEIFDVLPTVEINGSLKFSLAPGVSSNQVATFNVQVQDNGGVEHGGVDVSATQTFSVTITDDFNTAPRFIASNPPAVREDAGRQTIANWAAFHPGAPSESQQKVLAYQVRDIAHPELFQQVPSVSRTGTLTYVPAPNAFGSSTFTVRVRDDGGASGTGNDTSPSQTFTISITPVNDPPRLTVPADLFIKTTVGLGSIFTCGQSFTIPDFASVDAGADNEVQQLSGTAAIPFDLVQLDGTVIPSKQEVGSLDSAGTLLLDRLPCHTASNTILERELRIVVTDNGGVHDGGVDRSQTKVVTLRDYNNNPVVRPNNPPSVTAATRISSLQDAGPQSIANWATFHPGFQDENRGQAVLAYLVTNVSHPFLFTVPPAIGNDGTLTFTPAPNISGKSTFVATVQDDGGVSGQLTNDTSIPRTFTIEVTAVNHRPSLSAPGVFITAEPGPRVIHHWAAFQPANIDGEDLQTALAYTVSDATPAEFFDVPPTVDRDGVLRFSLAPGASVNDTATFMVQVQDNGGTANGGVDLSVPRSFSITIVEPNTAPTFTASNPPASLEDAGQVVVANWAAFDPGRPEEATQRARAYVVTDVSAPNLFSALPMISPDGTLRYTAAPHENGTATFKVRVQDDGGTAIGGQDTSIDQQFTITITRVNDEPVIHVPIILAIDTSSGAFNYEVPSFATFDPGPVDGPGNESQQSPTYFAGNLFQVDAGVVSLAFFLSNSSGKLGITVGRDTTTDKPAEGFGKFLAWVDDSGGTSNGGDNRSQTVEVGVITGDRSNGTHLNNAPRFSAAAVPAVTEDAGPQSIANWATFFPGFQDENIGQAVLAYHVTDVELPDLFSEPPRIDLDGTLTFTPAPNASGTSRFTATVQDDGGAIIFFGANLGNDTSNPKTFKITVGPNNDAPSFTAGDVMVNEDAGEQSIANWITAFDPGPADEAGQLPLAYLVENVSDSSLFSIPPAVSLDGTLTFKAAENANGMATFAVQVQDNGGVGNGGVDLSEAQTFTITVQSVNDRPEILATSPPSVDEGATLQTLPGWATFAAGPANEANQLPLAFTVSNISDPAFFENAPQVAADGTLTYRAARDAFGTATFEVTVQDDGGLERNGQDTSPPFTATITVTGINDRPLVNADNPPTVEEDAGPQTVTGWASFDPGAPGESGQSAVEWKITSVSNPALFTTQPTIAADGTLTYQPAANAFGAATIGVTVKDNGGTAGIAQDVSFERQFDMTVLAVNDVPTITGLLPQTLDAGANLTLDAGATRDVEDGVELTYEWDFNADGQADFTTTYARDTIPATTLHDLGLGAGEHPLHLVVVDSEGARSASAETTLTVSTAFTLKSAVALAEQVRVSVVDGALEVRDAATNELLSTSSVTGLTDFAIVTGDDPDDISLPALGSALGLNLMIDTGGGDDHIGLSDTTFEQLVAGLGFDTLQLTTHDNHLDLTSLTVGQLQGIEELDIIGASPNELTLDLPTVLALSDETDTLVIRHDEDDVVNFGTGWTVAAPDVVDGQFMHVIQQGTAELLVINTLAWQNPLNPLDANLDGAIAPIDVLVIVNTLNADGSRPLTTPLTAADASDLFYYDTTGDGFVSPLDALLAINFLNAPTAAAEGESPIGWIKNTAPATEQRLEDLTNVVPSQLSHGDVPTPPLSNAHDSVFAELADRQDNERWDELFDYLGDRKDETWW